MNQLNKKTLQETHPLFPSGDWEGFYTYALGPNAAQHKMSFHLEFHSQTVRGTGSDDVGGFFWDGEYDKEKLKCSMVKSYVAHTVSYKGHVDENGIWGTWEMAFMKGGFHIWPKGNNGSKKKKEKKSIKLTAVKKEKLKAPKELKKWSRGIIDLPPQ